jgi:hypothetical protein
VRGGVLVELQRPRERLEHLLGGVLVASLLEPHVVVDAHAGQQRDLLAAQPAHAAAAAEAGKRNVLGTDQLTARSKVLADEVVACHTDNDTPAAVPILAVPLPGSAGLLWGPAGPLTLGA